MKYKKCHLERAQQPRVSRQEALETTRRAERRRTCFHPEASQLTCRGTIINAHSIQRSGGGLTAIARNGHVYGYSTGFAVAERTGRIVAPKLVGVHEASTFTGFCAHHDAELFRPIESTTLEPTAEQLALLGFRAICRDLMAKQFAVSLNPFLRATGDRGTTAAFQAAWQRHMRANLIGNQLAITDLENAKAGFARAIVAKDFSTVRAVVFELDAVPTVYVSSPLTPEFDFGARHLQDLANAERVA